jgi:hypothetical protein
MSDPFIDALHERLTAARTPAADAGKRMAHSAALAGWWNEFDGVIGQKVGAWNERQGLRPPHELHPAVEWCRHTRYWPSAD